MTLKPRNPVAYSPAALAMCALALAACGGGGGAGTGTGGPVSTLPTPATQAVPVTVIDGAIKDATVCLDKNGNGVCDTGEPQGSSDAAGKVTLTVDDADVGKFAVIAMVGADAIDAASGVVGIPFVLKAPADQVAVLSPLTTLVQAQIDSSGGSTAQALAFVQAQTGLAMSLLADYTLAGAGAGTGAGNADALLAATLARLIVVTTQQQANVVAAALGQKDSSGATIGKADLDQAINRALLGALPALAAAAADASVAVAGGAREAAIAALAKSIVQTSGLDMDSVTALVGIAKLPPDAAGAPAAFANLRMLSFIDANNWSYRAMEGTVADATPNGAGMRHYYELHQQSVAGVVTTWGLNGSPERQGDLHWNGATWTGCPLGFRSAQTARDVKGFTAYNDCDGLELGVSQRSSADLGGQSLLLTAALIRKFPDGDGNVKYANWGPSNLSVLGTTTFPDGATVYYQSNQVLASAYSYDVTNKVSVFSEAVAAGGSDATVPPSACVGVTPANAASLQTLAPTLELVVARNPGKACLFKQGSDSDGNASLPLNEAWGNSTIGLGALPDTGTAPTPYYSGTAILRVGFDASGNGLTFYRCLDRKLMSSARNCGAIGSGTYSIKAVGDARVLTMSNPPLLAQQLGYTRILVERGGAVYYGSQGQMGGIKRTVRLNLTAANAFLSRLGIPLIAPN
ncbi:hypothetical protein AAKU55_003406 [Oxalobacteraceae bacterium GrIS 1.11]